MTNSMPRAAALLTILVLAACAPAAPSTAPGADAGTRLDARLLQMVDQRRADTGLVDLVLSDPNPARRVRGALAVGQVKIRARYPSLRRLLTSPDTLVAANAAYALGVARDTASLQVLSAVVADGPEGVAREAAWALGEIGEPSRGVLLAALGEGTTDPVRSSPAARRPPAVRAMLLRALVKLRTAPVGVLRPWVSDSDVDAARAAAYVIGRQRLAGGVRALLSVSTHGDEEIRQHVARGLALPAAGDSLASAARAALATLLSDQSPRVRANAARSVASYGPPAMRDFERAMTDADASVRVAASETVQAVYARDTAAWQRAWRRDTTFRVRQLLLVGARAAGVNTLARAELEWSRDPDWRRRMAALEVRAADPRADRLGLAREFVRDADPRVRASALTFIPTTATDADVRALVAPSLLDSELTARAAALAILVPRAGAADIETALTSHARAARDVEDQARVAALRLLASAWRRDSARVTPAVRARLTAFSAKGSAAERRAVAGVPPMAAWVKAAPSEVPRALAEYERIARQWLVPQARMPRAVIRTERGDVTVELFASDAPLVVEAFVRLASTGFYRNTYFHRVIPNFVAQDGDPRGDGSGGPGFMLRDSPTRRRHERGALGLATSGPDTGGSQYYLCHSAQPHLDGGYTVFGRVIDGLDVMDRILQGDRMLRIDIR